MSEVKMQTDTIIENRDTREQYINRVEVLEKVKGLFLIPEMECMTIRQVAEYYEVDYDTLRKCYERNQTEIDLDGVSVKTPIDFKKILKGTSCHVKKPDEIFKGTSCTFKNPDKILNGYQKTVKKPDEIFKGTSCHVKESDEILKVTSCVFKNLEQKNGKLIVQIDDNITLEIPNRGIRVFPKRAILRMGMLLRDSKVAQEVRTQLLNSFENTTDNQKTEAIDEEIELQNAIGRAYATGNPLEILNATSALDQYKNRYISRLENSNKTLTNEKKILAGEILKWTDRNSASKLIRTLAGCIGVEIGIAYNMVYNELLYKHGISLKARGKKPWIQYLKENEWSKLYQSVAALCESNNVRVSELFTKAKIDISGLN